MMSKPSRHFIPDGWPTVVPRLVADDAAGLVAFVRRVFGARGRYQAERPSEMRIGDSVILITQSGERKPVRAFLYVYVANTDAAYRRALAAGARSIEEPFDLPYGDRRCMVKDPWGNTWQIATHLRSPRQKTADRPRRRRPA